MAVVDHGLKRHPLHVQLRHYRERSGLSQRQVAQALGWSASKVHRIEVGISPITEADLRRLLTRYRTAAENEVARLLLLAHSARRDRTAAPDGSEPPSVRRYLDYEGAAGRIWNFEPMFVPGLLQTPGYSRALLSRIAATPTDEETIELGLAARRYRQEILHRTPPVQLHVLIDESAIERQVGGPAVMADQIQHLWAMSERANIALGIVPLSVGVYPQMRLPFVVLEFTSPEQPTLLFLESPHGGTITHENEDGAGPHAFAETFTKIWSQAQVGRAATERLRRAWRSTSQIK